MLFLLQGVTSVTQQHCLSEVPCFMPSVRRCPLPAIEATKNGLPRSHGGKTGSDNRRAGWSTRSVTALAQTLKVYLKHFMSGTIHREKKL